MRRTVSKNNRVLGLIAAMALASFTVGGLVYVVSTGQAAELADTTGRLGSLRVAAGDLATAIGQEQSSLDDFVLSRTVVPKERFDAAVQRETTAFATMRSLTGDLPAVRRELALLEDAAVRWRTEVAAPAMKAVAEYDLAGIARFDASSVGDHDVVDSQLGALADSLKVADAAVATSKAAVGATTGVGVTIAFGFLLVAFAVALFVVRGFGRALEKDAEQARVLNRFTELTSFATDDHELAVATLVALGRLVQPDAAVTHILNRSTDRAVPDASTGSAIAEILPLHELGRCAGVLRGTVYVTDDLADDMAVHCPVYPASAGTLACIPLISGESVGAVHLYWDRPQALPLSQRAGIARITEHAALAIGNRRLLTALHGQANTDGRTGLSNSRSFDLALEHALSARAKHEPLSVLMLDIDHFKLFNDRHGHPAGDEALKAFATVLRSCMREHDLAARYGGEEFAVFLPGVGLEGAAAVAERIRSRTEATVIGLAPGITDRITISIGAASAPDQADDRVTLLRLADAALYAAKEAGRNRVGTIVNGEPWANRDEPSAASGPMILTDVSRSEPPSETVLAIDA